MIDWLYVFNKIRNRKCRQNVDNDQVSFFVTLYNGIGLDESKVDRCTHTKKKPDGNRICDLVAVSTK